FTYKYSEGCEEFTTFRSLVSVGDCGEDGGREFLPTTGEYSVWSGGQHSTKATVYHVRNTTKIVLLLLLLLQQQQLQKEKKSSQLRISSKFCNFKFRRSQRDYSMSSREDCDSGELHPLKTWEELIEWKEPSVNSDEIVNVKKLCSRASHHPPTYPNTLICHDMKGGYLEDSHSLVTIPPPGWINTAHQHGVKVLGTFITEWDTGSAICKKMLASKDSVANCVSQLVKIASYHSFEGWLINIENEIDPEQIGLLKDFVQRLTLGMKEACPSAVVIWYDSVTIEGKLKWQNELNDLNRAFFDACNGIFLNYTWTDDHLKRSQEAAGERSSQVYVGLDVFGRNFYGGGKFNTFKAMEAARAHNLSAAIFAQGWTYETQDNFVEAENRLWDSLAPYLAHHGPQCLPFRTSFCQGFGEKCFLRGKIVRNDPWHNLSNQHYQPLWSQEGDAKLSLVTCDAFSGGGCLSLTTASTATVRLFVCGISWRLALLVSVCYKWQGPVVPFSLLLHLGPTTCTEDFHEKAWVTQTLFRDYILDYFSLFIKKYTRENNLSNYTSPATFKAYYTRRSMQQLVRETENQTIKQFGLENIKLAWDKVTSSNMNGVWQNLWPNCMRSFRGFTAESVLTIRNPIVELAQEVDTDNVAELLDLHTQELMDEELFLLDKQRHGEENRDPGARASPEVKELTVKTLAAIIDSARQSIELSLDNDPQLERAFDLEAKALEALHRYEVLQQEKKAKARQTTLTQFFAVNPSGQTTEPQPSTTRMILPLQCEKYSDKHMDDNAHAERCAEMESGSSKIEKNDKNDVAEPLLVVDTKENDWTVKSFIIKEVEGCELKQIDINLGGGSTLLIGELHISNQSVSTMC
ncbi:Cytosolic endo-beta-N-acetylglucosaminidase 2-like, partial [Homarus americanus]